MRVKTFAVFLFLTASTLLGCASKPIFVQLDVAGPSSAEAQVREIGGTTDPAPVRCTTPCRIEFSPKGVFEVELRADGFYPALLAVEYVTMDQYKRVRGIDEPPLVVPMIPRD